jgi:hypothetical protein
MILVITNPQIMTLTQQAQEIDILSLHMANLQKPLVINPGYINFYDQHRTLMMNH